MATFDEKELLCDEIYNSIEVIMSKKAELDKDYPEEWINDFKALNDFRRQIVKMEPSEIDYEDAYQFFEKIENKYKAMPDKW